MIANSPNATSCSLKFKQKEYHQYSILLNSKNNRDNYNNNKRISKKNGRHIKQHITYKTDM